MDESNRRIVILGKIGAGKSSLANTIFGEKLFTGTRKCQTETKSVNGRRITLIDTPGFFDTDSSEEEVKAEIVRCITECAPGPHAFLIVLKVEKFTQQEQAVINKIHQYFSEEVFKYAAVVFTHGDQLPEGLTIEDFFSQNTLMSDLVKKCGGCCHVVDNKYWKNNQQDEYRSNKFQVAELLNTLDKMIETNKGSCYTNEMLGNMSENEIREQAKASVTKKLLIKLTGMATGALLGGIFGGVVSVAVQQAVVAGVFGGIGGKTGTAGIALSTLTLAPAAAGAVIGGVKGYYAAEGADTPGEAAKRAAEAVKNGA